MRPDSDNEICDMKLRVFMGIAYTPDPGECQELFLRNLYFFLDKYRWGVIGLSSMKHIYGPVAQGERGCAQIKGQRQGVGSTPTRSNKIEHTEKAQSYAESFSVLAVRRVNSTKFGGDAGARAE